MLSCIRIVQSLPVCSSHTVLPTLRLIHSWFPWCLPPRRFWPYQIFRSNFIYHFSLATIKHSQASQSFCTWNTSSFWLLEIISWTCNWVTLSGWLPSPQTQFHGMGLGVEAGVPLWAAWTWEQNNSICVLKDSTLESVPSFFHHSKHRP